MTLLRFRPSLTYSYGPESWSLKVLRRLDEVVWCLGLFHCKPIIRKIYKKSTSTTIVVLFLQVWSLAYNSWGTLAELRIIDEHTIGFVGRFLRQLPRELIHWLQLDLGLDLCCAFLWISRQCQFRPTTDEPEPIRYLLVRMVLCCSYSNAVVSINNRSDVSPMWVQHFLHISPILIDHLLNSGPS